MKESMKRSDFKVLVPLIQTTLRNATYIGPQSALTGPAKRKAYEIIDKHLDFLKSYDEDVYQIYKLLSGIILKIG